MRLTINGAKLGAANEDGGLILGLLCLNQLSKIHVKQVWVFFLLILESSISICGQTKGVPLGGRTKQNQKNHRSS